VIYLTSSGERWFAWHPCSIEGGKRTLRLPPKISKPDMLAALQNIGRQTFR
jgi:hypothetical protein